VFAPWEEVNCMKVLIAEDDRKLSAFLVRAFSEEGYVVDSCRSGNDTIEQARLIAYDLMVLDWMLPESDGLSVCRALRKAGNQVPVLMLTARNEVGEKVQALDAGADDYLTKPFHLDELMARARSLIRRGAGNVDALRVGPVTADLRHHTVHVDGAKVDLTGREFALLTLLMRNAGRVVTRAEILSQVWETNTDLGSNVIDVNVRHVRDKLGAQATLLETIRGQGYRFALVEAEAMPT
jgi:DNA-binding response OmpR family regulator